jgi:xanthosine utilization system XapX-like protein
MKHVMPLLIASLLIGLLPAVTATPPCAPPCLPNKLPGILGCLAGNIATPQNCLDGYYCISFTVDDFEGKDIPELRGTTWLWAGSSYDMYVDGNDSYFDGTNYGSGTFRASTSINSAALC